MTALMYIRDIVGHRVRHVREADDGQLKWTILGTIVDCHWNVDEGEVHAIVRRADASLIAVQLCTAKDAMPTYRIAPPRAVEVQASERLDVVK